VKKVLFGIVEYNESMMPLGHKFVLATLALFSLILPAEAPLQFPFWRTLIAFVISLIVLTIILYVAGLVVVGGDRAKLSSAFAITLLGTFVSFVLNMVFTLLLPVSLSWEYVFIFRAFLSLIVWLSLIKNFYKTGWLGALAVAILTVIIMIVLELLLASLLIALII